MHTIGKFSGRRGGINATSAKIVSGIINRIVSLAAVTVAIAAALMASSTPARAGAFSLTAEIDPARQFHTATLLPNGKVLVAGGYGSGGVGWLIDCQLYDPQKGEFVLTGRLTTRRDAHTATLLPNGKVLIAGGEEVNEGGFSVLLASAELYDPASGLFSHTGSMVTGRELHTATHAQQWQGADCGRRRRQGLCRHVVRKSTTPQSARSFPPAAWASAATATPRPRCPTARC